MSGEHDLIKFLRKRGVSLQLAWEYYAATKRIQHQSFVDFLKEHYPVEHVAWRLLK